MKSNEAPEKLYLINDVDAVMLSYDPPTKLQGNRYDFVDKEVFPIEEGCEVEYTRTDAFIEKACGAYCKVCKMPNCRSNECRMISDFKGHLENT